MNVRAQLLTAASATSLIPPPEPAIAVQTSKGLPGPWGDMREEFEANASGTSVQTSLGPALSCSYSLHSPSPPGPAAVLRPDVIPATQVGGRLMSTLAQRDWKNFFSDPNKGGPFRCKFADHISSGMAPELTTVPVQMTPPPVRKLDAVRQAATDIRVREIQSKGIIEEVSAPTMASALPPSQIDRKFIYTKEAPFLVPRTIYPFIHDFFLVAKATKGKWRDILNCALFNLLCVKHHIKFENLMTLVQILQRDDFMTALDITAAYPHVGIKKRFRNLFMFRHVFAGEKAPRWFRYIGMCFGLHAAPRLFTRLLRPILGYLRSSKHSLKVVNMLDDFNVNDFPAEVCTAKTQTLIDTFQSLHFLFEPTKCELHPLQHRIFLGALVDSKDLVFRLPKSKRRRISGRAATMMECVQRRLRLPMRGLASLLGVFRATRDMVAVAFLLTRELLRWLNLCVATQLVQMGIDSKHSNIILDDERSLDLFALASRKAESTNILRRGPDAPAWLSRIKWGVDVFALLPAEWVRVRTSRLVNELRWWAEELRLWNGKWIHAPPTTAHFTCDASGFGGGLCLRELTTRWFWVPAERIHSICWKELAVPELGLRALERELERGTDDVAQSRISGQNFLAEIDNVAAVANINHMGGSVQRLSELAESLWRFLLKRGSWMQARHLAGVLNVRADLASRWTDDRSEWRLSEQAWSLVEATFGPHSVDVMASRRNTMLPRFFSRWIEPDAAEWDALRQDWALEDNVYCHPPFIMIPQVLAHVRKCKCEITLIAPLWASQPWMPTLMEMSCRMPQLLLCETLVEPTSVIKGTATQPGWSTAVWRVSGESCSTEAFRASVSSKLWNLGRRNN